MRTTRVGAVTGNVHGKARRSLETDSSFTFMDKKHSLHDFGGSRQGQGKKKKQPASKHVLVNKRQHILIKGIQFEADTITATRNHLIRQSRHVNYISKMKRRHDTYRTSI